MIVIHLKELEVVNLKKIIDKIQMKMLTLIVIKAKKRENTIDKITKLTSKEKTKVQNFMKLFILELD